MLHTTWMVYPRSNAQAFDERVSQSGHVPVGSSTLPNQRAQVHPVLAHRWSPSGGSKQSDPTGNHRSPNPATPLHGTRSPVESPILTGFPKHAKKTFQENSPLPAASGRETFQSLDSRKEVPQNHLRYIIMPAKTISSPHTLAILCTCQCTAACRIPRERMGIVINALTQYRCKTAGVPTHVQ